MTDTTEQPIASRERVDAVRTDEWADVEPAETEASHAQRCFRVGGPVTLTDGQCPECGWSVANELARRERKHPERTAMRAKVAEQAAEIERLQSPDLMQNLEQWDILPGGTYEPAFANRLNAIGKRYQDACATIARVEALQVEWSHRGETVRSSRELTAALKGDS